MCTRVSPNWSLDTEALAVDCKSGALVLCPKPFCSARAAEPSPAQPSLTADFVTLRPLLPLFAYKHFQPFPSKPTIHTQYLPNHFASHSSGSSSTLERRYAPSEPLPRNAFCRSRRLFVITAPSPCTPLCHRPIATSKRSRLSERRSPANNNISSL